jgi:polyferredoxin
VVGLTPDGTIIGVKLVQQRETPGFFRLVQGQGFTDQFIGQAYDQPFIIGQDLDAVSGATFSAEGVAAAARAALHILAADAVGRTLPPTPVAWRIGLPEVVLVLLYAAGYVGHRLRRKVWQQRIRWATLLTGMVVLGFIYTMPFTIAQVATLLSGYWPDWHTNLYWYLLLGGIIFVAAVDAKNPYCSWFCPFGAFQECLAAVSGAKHYRPRRWSTALTWVQRGLALTAILLGLALRRPGVAGYEPFATLFDLRGTPVQWIFLLVIVLASLVIYRPFCNYLCPLDPVFDFVGEGRRQVREVWRRWQARRAKA